MVCSCRVVQPRSASTEVQRVLSQSRATEKQSYKGKPLVCKGTFADPDNDSTAAHGDAGASQLQLKVALRVCRLIEWWR